MDKLSMLASFDDLRRCCGVLTSGVAEIEFHRFIQKFDQYQLNWLATVQEAQRLQREVDDSFNKLADLESKLSHARKLLEIENKARREAEQERYAYEKKMNAVWDIFRNDQNITQETRDKFGFLNNQLRKRRSSAVRVSEKYKGNDINSTGSFLSDLSLTQSEDDFLDKSTKGWKEYRPSTAGNQVQVGGKRSRKSVEQAIHKKRSMEMNGADKIVAHTKVSIPQEGEGPITAESIIESIPQQVVYQTPRRDKRLSPDQYKTPAKVSDSKVSTFQTPSAPPLSELNQNNKMTFGQNMLRPHSFASRNFLRSDTCNACQKKIRFGSVALKCRVCRVRVHTDCSHIVHVACVPQNGTPNMKSDEAMGLVGDYAPTIGPMVPALIVHCVNEIETRGLQEVGLYRVSGTEREVKVLKERFIRGKEVPCIGNIDVHVLCGCIKDFLRSLRECLIPTVLWTEFSNAVQNVDDAKKSNELFAVIDKLPQSNRDTLAFLMQHFQRIANVPEVKMPLTNIAKVFGPTIVGYSSPFPEQQAIFAETHIQFTVMRDLLNIPTDYWAKFVNVSIERPVARKESYKIIDFYSKPAMKSAQKERKYYATPPYSNKKK